MAEAEKKHQKLKDITEQSRYWDAEDLLRNLELEMQRMEQGLSHLIWDMENRPVTRCPFPLPATPKFEVDDKESEFKVKVRLPDVKKENINVTIGREGVEVYARQDDRMCRPFYVNIDSPTQLDPDEVTSTLEEGVLTVTVKKIKKTRVKVQ